LSLAWWPDRKRLDSLRLRHVAASFIGYNIGVGLLFLVHEWTADRFLTVSWLVGNDLLEIIATFL